MERTKFKNPWKDKHILKIRENREPQEISEENFKEEALRSEIEPWLTALFQSEHLSLLTGAGLSSAVHHIATSNTGAGMSKMVFSEFGKEIKLKSDESAKIAGRGEANIEDQIRVVNELIRGLEIYTSVNQNKELDGLIQKRETIVKELAVGIINFTKEILNCEKNIVKTKEFKPAETLMSFLMSFASRSATRERLNIFTTNYDRVIEFGSELAGIHLLDRFEGTIFPIFRSSRLKLDMHYNPPGIRGEPRYLEGVAYITKLHGSIDWTYKDGYVRRIALPYGASDISMYSDEGAPIMIYPNSSKDRETAEYPYLELFRDLAAAICRPNSTLVVYGYSFGDEHINRVIADMLSIPSTHLVIISYDDNSGRLNGFYNKVMRPAQITLLIGKRFGDLETLVKFYLPKSAIDRTTIRMVELLKARGIDIKNQKNEDEDLEDIL